MPTPIQIDAHAGRDGETISHRLRLFLPAEEVRYARAVLASHPAFFELVLFHAPEEVRSLEDWDGAEPATDQPLVALELSMLHVRSDHCVLRYRPADQDLEFVSERIDA